MAWGLLLIVVFQVAWIESASEAWAVEPMKYETCGKSMRNYVLGSTVRSVFFPFFGPGFFQVVGDWNLGLRATWRTGALLEDVSTFIQHREALPPEEQPLFEPSELDLPVSIQTYYQKFVKGHRGYEKRSVSQILALLHSFNTSSVEKGECFLPCHEEGSLKRCTRRHLLRWIDPRSSNSPDVQIIAGEEWVNVDLEIYTTDVEE